MTKGRPYWLFKTGLTQHWRVEALGTSCARWLYVCLADMAAECDLDGTLCGTDGVSVPVESIIIRSGLSKKTFRSALEKILALNLAERDANGSLRIVKYQDHQVELAQTKQRKEEEKSKSNERVKRHRDKQKAASKTEETTEQTAIVTPHVTPESVPCNADVTPCNAACNAEEALRVTLRNADVTPCNGHKIEIERKELSPSERGRAVPGTSDGEPQSVTQKAKSKPDNADWSWGKIVQTWNRAVESGKVPCLPCEEDKDTFLALKDIPFKVASTMAHKTPSDFFRQATKSPAWRDKSLFWCLEAWVCECSPRQAATLALMAYREVTGLDAALVPGNLDPARKVIDGLRREPAKHPNPIDTIRDVVSYRFREYTDQRMNNPDWISASRVFGDSFAWALDKISREGGVDAAVQAVVPSSKPVSVDIFAERRKRQEEENLVRMKQLEGGETT